MLILMQTDRISIASPLGIALVAFKLLPFSHAPTKAQLLFAGFHCTFPGKLKNKLQQIFNNLTPFRRQRCMEPCPPCPHGCSPASAGPADPGADGHEMVPQHRRTTCPDTDGHGDTQGHSEARTDTHGPALTCAYTPCVRPHSPSQGSSRLTWVGSAAGALCLVSTGHTIRIPGWEKFERTSGSYLAQSPH